MLFQSRRMLDMGFEEDVRFIISKCKPKEFRQTAMFSATWPAAIQQLALEFMVRLNLELLFIFQLCTKSYDVHQTLIGGACLHLCRIRINSGK